MPLNLGIAGTKVANVLGRRKPGEVFAVFLSSFFFIDFFSI